MSDNDSAFPTTEFCDEKNNVLNVPLVTGGLTKRELFAAMLLMGHADRQGNDWESLTKDAVRGADALLAELAKKDKV